MTHSQTSRNRRNGGSKPGRNAARSGQSPGARGAAKSADFYNDGGQRREKLAVYDPAHGRLIAEMPLTTTPEMEDGLDAGRRAFEAWQRITVAERCRQVRQAGQVLVKHRQELLDLLVAETGKAIVDAQAEFLTLFETFRYYTTHGAELLAEKRPRVHLLKNKRVRVQYSPRGVVVNISPWNFPLDLSLTPAIPALIAGNAVVIKPSEHAPLTVYRAVELMNQAGLPAGLLQVMIGRGELGQALGERADAISFTGSVATGKKVAQTAARRLIPCTLELGGKDAAIVLEDADLERAARGIVWGAFFNAGQVCMSVERVYVHEAVYDDFVERVVALTRELRQGVPVDQEVDLGAMIDPGQISTIEGQLADAIKRGARVLAGGSRMEPAPSTLYPPVPPHPPSEYERADDAVPILRDADFFAPTVLVGVDHSMKIMTEETFGPVLPIMKVRSAFEAVKLANDSPFGLNASVWGRDLKRARQIAADIEAGQVCINDVIASYLATEAPYGGVKHSGLGRRKGPGELYKFVESKTVLEDILKLKKEPYWYPYSPGLRKTIDKALGALYQRGVIQKIGDLLR